MSSGFPIHKPTRSPVGVAPAPASLTVTLGARSGELDASATAASTTFGNLTPGVVYNIEANAVSTASPGDWSNPVSQMVV